MTRLCLAALSIAIALPAAPAWADDLVGLWEATRNFDPEVRGPLVFVERRDGALVADIAGFSVPVTNSNPRWSFDLPDGKGSFRGHGAERSGEIHGFWIQPATVSSGAQFATPVTMRAGPNGWRGEVTPLEDHFTYYLPIARAADGSLATYLRNPERNDGIFTQVKSIAMDGTKASVVGNPRGSKEQRTLFDGRYEEGVLTIVSPGRGGTYDFHKVDAEDSSPFYPRGRKPAKYAYVKPLQRDDGWPTATPEEVGMTRAALESFVQYLIDMPMASVNTSQVHSVLIARHGKLVLDEYFHGHHRDLPHDTRSAAKALGSVLIGAAMQSGVDIGLDTPVYKTMLGTLPPGIDPRKRAMTLENLLMMRGGHFCDDGNDDAPGNENTMQSQDKERDWYRFILALPMDRTPGEKTVYCSIDAHLAGGVLAKAAGEPWADLFDRLVARPLHFGRYSLFLSPTGEAYTGGGHRLLSRDFLKVAQLMLNDGMWEGHRIVSREWARKSTAPLAQLGSSQQYGYFWNSIEYPYRDRKVRAFFAAGNGGQIYMGIPELDLAIAFTGGNYADASLFIPQRVMVPERIFPAVQ